MNEWCQIFIVDGKQVLFTNNDCGDEDGSEGNIKITVRVRDFIEGSDMGEIALAIKGDEPFTDEAFQHMATQEIAEKFVNKEIKPLLAKMESQKEDFKYEV